MSERERNEHVRTLLLLIILICLIM